MGGGGWLANWTPPTRAPPPPKKKNSSRIIPCISGKTPASHTLNIGAYMTKHVKIHENTNTNRLGMESERIICIRFSKKKPTTREDPPPLCKRRKLSIYLFKKMKILPHNVYPRCRRKIGENINKQSAKRAHKAPFAFVFQNFSRGDPDTPHLTQFFWPALPGWGAPPPPPPPPLKSATGTPPLNFWLFDDVLCASCCPSFNLAPFL